MVRRPLVIQLRRELDLPGIVWSTPGRSDRTEVYVRVVARIGNHNAVATEIRLIEIRMVRNVVELRAERERVPLVELEVLEH